MAAAAGLSRNNEKSGGGPPFERLRQFRNSFARNGRTIDRYKRKSIRFRRQCCERGLQRAELASARIGVHYDLHAFSNLRPDRIGMIAEHDGHWAALCAQHASQARHERFAAIIEQRFGHTHAAGRARRQDEAGDHFRSAFSRSCAKIDFESCRQSASGARRTAIISATTEIAISSGSSAPISRPMGANTFSNASRGMPSFSSSWITEIVLRLLPIMAMYF